MCEDLNGSFIECVDVIERIIDTWGLDDFNDMVRNVQHRREWDKGFSKEYNKLIEGLKHDVEMSEKN